MPYGVQVQVLSRAPIPNILIPKISSWVYFMPFWHRRVTIVI